MQILLASSGFSNPKVWNKFANLVKEKDYKTAVIVTTAHPKKEKAIWAQETKRQMSSIGLSVSFVDFEKGEGKNIEADVIYVCGGNTFRLLKGAMEVDFKKEVEGLFKRGGTYVGSSAGSIILSPTIATASEISPDKNEVGLSDLSGLDVISFHIVPHYRKEDAKSFDNFKKRHIEGAEALEDGEALYINENDVVRISC